MASTSRRRPPHVHKFGGASLADAAAMRQAVRILADHAAEPTVVVVSAMAGVTDQLLTLAREAASGDLTAPVRLVAALEAGYAAAAKTLLPAAIRKLFLAWLKTDAAEVRALATGLSLVRELTPRSSDLLAARGERWSARLLAAALQAAGVPAVYVDATELIATDGAFGAASPDFAGTETMAAAVLRPHLKAGRVPIVPGFIGRTPDGGTATLGRGGSDLTATLLARALGASRVSLWKDVPGFLTADPRVVPDARVLPQLHVREAAELASGFADKTRTTL